MASGDVFPSKHALPGDSVNWGREVETRIVGNEVSLEGLSQSVAGLNRSTASSLSDLATQLTALAAAQSTLATQQAELTTQQATLTAQQATLTAQQTALATAQADITATQNSIPVTTMQSNRATNISATSSTQTTKATVTFTVPAGKTKASVLGIGAVRITDTVTNGLTSSNARVVISGNAGGEFPAAKDAAVSQVINVLYATHAREFTVTPGSTFTVQVQVAALNPSAFPANAANFAQIAAIATFTP